MTTQSTLANFIEQYRKILSKHHLGHLLSLPAVSVILALGGINVANADDLYKALSGTQTISENVYYIGEEERLIYAQGYQAHAGVLNFTGETIFLKTTADTADVARVMMVAGYDSSLVPQINIGSKDKYATAVTLNVVNKTGNANTINAYGDGDDAKGGEINIYAETLSVSAISLQGGAYGLFVQNRTDSASGPVSTININAGKSFIDVHSDLPDSAYALVAMSQGNINIEGDLYVNTQGGTGAVLTARGDSTVIINSNANATVQLNGDIMFEYVESSNTPVDSTVNVSLTNENSWWNGNTGLIWWSDNPVDEKKLTVTKMTLNLENGATWIPTPPQTDDPTVTTTGKGYSPLNNLNLNGGVIKLNPNVHLQIDKLQGQGIVNMVVNPEASEQAGTLIATNTTGASLDINLLGVTSDDLSVEQAINLLQGVASTDGQLAVTGNLDEGLVNGALTLLPDGMVVHRNHVMDSILETASVSTTLLDRILTNDLRKRMGDLRSANAEQGLWLRWNGGQFKGDGGVTSKFHTIQIGTDAMLEQNFRVGLAAEFTRSDTDYSRSQSDMKGVSFAGYGVWMTENGLYTDVVGRLGSFKTDMKASGYEGTLDSLIASLSGEVGWRITLNEFYYVEPQLELSYAYINGDNFKVGPARYKLDNTDSLIGRAGLATAFKLPDDRGNLYARASVVRQFLGDTKISGHINKVVNTEKLNGDDSWFEYGIGINVFLTDAIYAWADIERTAGASLDEDWRGTVGLRYSF